MTYKVIIEGRFFGNHTFPSLNDYIHECAKHPQCGARMKRSYMMIANNRIRYQLKSTKIEQPVKIHYVFYEPDRKRDISNVASMFVKVFEDSLQACGVLPNDNWKFIKAYSQEFHIDKERPRVEVYISEIGEEDGYFEKQ